MSETSILQVPFSSLLVQAISPSVQSDSVSLKTVALIFLVALVLILFVSRVRQNDIWSFRLAILSLLGIGITLLFVQLPYVDHAFTHSLGDALVIAAVLAFTVDFYLKERVL